MGADILERLELMLHARLTDEDTIIREAAAEIVRLREDNLRQANAMYADGMASELMDIAPAEAKGEGELPTTDAEVEADNAKAADRACLLAIANGYVWDGAAWVKPPALQPADGGAVAEWQVWHEQDGWGATHPDNVAEYRARGVPVRPLYAHPPAPVQAAPQEGEGPWLGEALRFLGELESVGNLRAGEVARGLRRHAALQHRGDSQEVGRE